MKLEELWKQKALSKGDKTMKQPRMHPEQDLQIECVQWFDAHFPRLKHYLHHSPNGGSRNKVEASNFKHMGTRKGFPDLIWWMQGLAFLEFKSEKGRLEPEQKEFEEEAKAVGAVFQVVKDKLTFMRVMHLLLAEARIANFQFTEQELKTLLRIEKEIHDEEVKQTFREQIQAKAKEARKGLKKL